MACLNRSVHVSKISPVTAESFEPVLGQTDLQGPKTKGSGCCSRTSSGFKNHPEKSKSSSQKPDFRKLRPLLSDVTFPPGVRDSSQALSVFLSLFYFKRRRPILAAARAEGWRPARPGRDAPGRCSCAVLPCVRSRRHTQAPGTRELPLFVPRQADRSRLKSKIHK